MVIEDRSSKRSGAGRFFLFLFVLALLGGAFYAGARYRDRVPFLPGLANVTNTQPITEAPTPTPVVEDPLLKFEKARAEVDRDPRNWINAEIPKELVSSGVQSALESPNSSFLYLYGRASLLTGNADEAMRAFEAAITKAGSDPSADTVKKEAALGMAAASLKTQKDREKALSHLDEAFKAPPAPTSP